MENANYEAKLSHLVERQNQQSLNTANHASAINAIEAAISRLEVAVQHQQIGLQRVRDEVGEQRSLLAILRRKLYSFLK